MDISPHINNPESPPLRSTVLGFGASFLRGRPRATSQVDNSQSAVSPSPGFQPDLGREPPSSQPRSQNGAFRTSGVQGNSSNTAQASHNQTGTTPDSAPPVATSTSLGLSMLRRRRSAGAANAVMSSALVTRPVAPAPSSSCPGASHRIRLVPHLDSRRTLCFEAICRNVKDGDAPLRIGRFTDRSGMGVAAANAITSNRLAFKSKVVSRAHAEIWVDADGKFFIKDTKSSSGTFLNHARLSAANTESKPHQIKDGDILQLGVDYQGGTEDIYKSVKIRIELGREWQAAANAFNTNALNQLKSLAVSTAVDPSQGEQVASKKSLQKINIPDCCICLFSVTIRQALFIAPCSHAFHYKCVRPLLEAHNSAFSCPLCRTFANLEEDVEVEADAGAEIQDEVKGPGHEHDLAGEADHSASGSAEGETGTNVVNQPSTRTRNRSREREGAETEVEADAGRLRPGMQRSQTRVHNTTSEIFSVTDMTQPDYLRDAEMADALDFGGRTPHLPASSGPNVDADAVDGTRSASLSPDFSGHNAVYMVPRYQRYIRAGTSGGAGAGIYTSEGEGSGGSAEEVMIEADFLGNEGNGGVEGDMTVGGKRKR